jgi:hypothetical protein
MKIVDPLELMKGFRRVDLSVAEPLELRGVLDDLRRVRARFDLVEAAVATKLKGSSATPERDVAKGAQRANKHGNNILKRANTLAETPSLGQALETGALSGEHVDVFAKVLASLDGPVKTQLAEAAPALVKAAATSGSTPDEFAASLNEAAERIAADGGMARFEQQRRAARLRTWTNKATGMWHLSGAFDPESGVVLHGRIEAAMAAMFATKTPSTAPSDPGEKQDHLRAVALLAITNGEITIAVRVASDDANQPDEWDAFTTAFANPSKRFGRPEMSVIIDTNNLDTNGNPTATCAAPGCTVAPTTANHTTSTGGDTAAPPTSPICFPCAANTTTSPTKADGCLPSDPTENSPSPSPTARSCEPARQVATRPHEARPSQGGPDPSTLCRELLNRPDYMRPSSSPISATERL